MIGSAAGVVLLVTGLVATIFVARRRQQINAVKERHGLQVHDHYAISNPFTSLIMIRIFRIQMTGYGTKTALSPAEFRAKVSAVSFEMYVLKNNSPCR